MEKRDDMEIAWRRCEDCCETAAGQLDPTMTLVVSVEAGGSGLSVTINANHACGIDSYAISILLKGPNDTDWWRFSKAGGANRWRWGPGQPQQLPVTPIKELRVYAGVTSKCGTGANDSKHIILM